VPYRRVRTTQVPEPVESPFYQLPTDTRPCFGELDFPINVHSAAYRREIGKLQRFYCPTREGKVKAPDADLIAFVHPDSSERVLFVYGDCGIGKSWYLRYSAQVTLPNRGCNAYFGMIDMRTGATDDLVHELHRKLNAILAPIAGGQTVTPQLEFQWGGAAQATENLVRENTAALARAGKLVVCIVDNIDLQAGDEQEALAHEAVRLLRDYSNLKIIVPLRYVTNNAFTRQGLLHQFLSREVELPPVELGEMLGLRLERSENGKSLSEVRVRTCDGREYSCPEVFSFFHLRDSIRGPARETQGFRFWRELAQRDARRALGLFEKMFYSNRLHGNPQNLRFRNWWISALMLGTSGHYKGRDIVNLFDNDVAGDDQAGKNSLIRYRVLEFFARGLVPIGDSFFHRYFECLGYTTAQTLEVIELLLDFGLIESPNSHGHSGGAPKSARITPLGRFYLDKMPMELWYIYMIKRWSIIDLKYISKTQPNYDWVEDNHFLDYVEHEEEIECAQIDYWQRQNGEIPELLLSSPSSAIRSAMEQARQGNDPEDDMENPYYS
jgi:hypothetical protein